MSSHFPLFVSNKTNKRKLVEEKKQEVNSRLTIAETCLNSHPRMAETYTNTRPRVASALTMIFVNSWRWIAEKMFGISVMCKIY